MMFASDNWAGAVPQVVEAIARQADGFAAPYGVSDPDRSIERRFEELFEREVSVFFVGTGTAANALALAAVNKPGGAVFCHRESHVVEDECGAVEFQTGGARLMQLDGPAGKIEAPALAAALDRFPADSVHSGQPMAVSVTQATEAGAVYDVAEIEALAGLAHGRGLALHMDGARFANAVVHLGVTPAEMTWKAGVDILSFGGTKNGCICAEALVAFRPDLVADLPFIRKRAGHLFSKSRFIAAQFDAYLRDDLWLDLARHANCMADRLRAAIAEAPAARLAWPTVANEVFVVMDESIAARLRAAGAVFYDWPKPHGAQIECRPGEGLFRLVTSFATRPQDVEALARALAA